MNIIGTLTSRRLGHALTVVNLPKKVCNYCCIYCQGGHTYQLEYDRSNYIEPLEIEKAVREKLTKSKDSNGRFDYIVFIPDGEPTRDINLGKEIDLLKPFGIKIAVVTNSALIWRSDVRKDLLKADMVSLKIDAASEKAWKSMNRPHKNLRLDTIMEGIHEFSSVYSGKLITETMLVDGINDHKENAMEIADYLEKLNPAEAYLSVPTRNPTLVSAKPPSESTLNTFFQIINAQVENLEYMIGYNTVDHPLTGNMELDLLNLLSFKPMESSEVQEFLHKFDSDLGTLDVLLKKSEIIETEYLKNKYYLRKIKLAYA